MLAYISQKYIYMKHFAWGTSHQHSHRNLVRIWPFKVVHHRCQAIAFMFNGGSCSSFTFYPIDTKICFEQKPRFDYVTLLAVKGSEFLLGRCLARNCYDPP